MEDIFCDCGEYLGVKYLETDEIEIDSEVEYSISIGYPNILHCPYCNKETLIKGEIKE